MSKVPNVNFSSLETLAHFSHFIAIVAIWKSYSELITRLFWTT